MNKDYLESPEFLHPGHAFCAGCGFIIAFRHILKVLGKDTILSITAGCLGTNSGFFPNSPIKVAGYNTPFASVAAAATGIRAALDARNNTSTHVIAVAGDGGTYDIGFQALSAAAERNENFIYCCYDNEGYMNTGVQRSSATPPGAWTTTTPTGKTGQKKNLPAIMMAHRIPYLATATPAYPEDFLSKVRKAAQVKGFRFLQVLSPCPPGWGIPSHDTLKFARLAVQTGVFPLYEIYDGKKIVINLEPEKVPIKDYLRVQTRFRFITDGEIEDMQQAVDYNWSELKARAAWFTQMTDKTTAHHSETI
ncbi:MAG: pyruvate synthase subunit beta [Deltaproteobacteria bacterium]|nr:pyruvate synthase subunit beta [Deltaproteobacteria bacterium]